MTFDELLRTVGDNDRARVRIDSRQVRPGDVFVAIEGTNLDGRAFIRDAVARGAKTIVCRKPSGLPTPPAGMERAGPVKIVEVEDDAEAAGLLAQASMGNPAKSLLNLAVTGTNGKTTVAFLVRSCLEAAGKRCGLLGTVLYDMGDGDRPANLTTPDCLTIADAQRQMVANGLQYMIIEASSHALSQHRLAGIEFAAAAFTNLSGDHLDYHKTKDNYLASKARLFRSLRSDATAVLNWQSPEARSIRDKTEAKILWYAIEEEADLTARIGSMSVDGATFWLERDGERQRVASRLVGKYNVANHLAAAGLCVAAGLSLEQVAAGLSALDTIPGRLETIRANGFAVVIDYAHTDDALRNVLAALKPLCQGRLIVVFGCGGDRDRSKRPRMARAAEDLADEIFVTSDNPRTEPQQQIIEDIIAGFADPRATRIHVDPDRERAIETAVRSAAAGDIVLIAGKGHETYQIIGQNRYDFSDKEVVQQCLGQCV